MTATRAVVAALRREPSLRGVRLTGLTGSLLLVFGSLGAGALPAYDPVAQIPLISVLRRGAGPTVALGLTYLGAATLTLAWLYLGRVVRSGPSGAGTAVRDLLRIGWWWGGPLLVAVPLFSRDLYSYAAQAQITHAGLDPYSVGPLSLPGPFLDEVEQLWVNTPAPYGPLWLTLGRMVAIVTRDHVVLTVLSMRLIAAGGVLLTARFLPRLATACGGDPRLAVWLSLLNPLLLIHFIGGGHNDALMLGLVVAGLTVAMEVTPGSDRARRRLALAVVLCTLAVLIKVPAALAVGFLVPIWAARIRAERPWLAATVRVTGLAVLTFVLATLATGLGIGWMRQLNGAGEVVNFLSIPTGLAMAFNALRGVTRLVDPGNATIAAFRLGGQAITAVIGIVLWTRSYRLHPVRALGVALLVLVMLGPVVQPWYLMWPLTLLAVAPLGQRAVLGLAWMCAWLVLLVSPQGAALLLNWTPVIVAGLAAAVATGTLLNSPPPPATELDLPEPAAAVPAASEPAAAPHPRVG
ncbi:MAG: polyprenol phosphomannose-dependent alpha 1,6 mannosyltransferase MptB [Actinobacteria bacterium]|nr:polyprenol phosphomannose-dependent alpha 1,6 mannosyltransferase MptB [Actinomycetota bacterium]